MLLAHASHTADEQIAAWYAENVAIWCHRLDATINHTTCKENQQRSTHKYGDLRCQGCGGLSNQTKQQSMRPALELAMVWDADKSITTEPDTPSGSAATANPIDGFSALDEIIDRLYGNPEPGDDFEDVELDLDDDELLALFPELAENPWPVVPRFSEYQTEAPRRAVYRGRCIKCRGWMEDTRERHDDNVFRCLGCGWRTSPDYERNRAIYAAGGVI